MSRSTAGDGSLVAALPRYIPLFVGTQFNRASAVHTDPSCQRLQRGRGEPHIASRSTATWHELGLCGKCPVGPPGLAGLLAVGGRERLEVAIARAMERYAPGGDAR